MDFKTDSLRVLILGASSAIGLSTCKRYLAAGHHVVAHYWSNAVPLKALSSNHRDIETIQIDLGNLEAVGSIIHDASITSCDVLVCLASLALPTSIENIPIDTLERTLNVGALSNFLMMGSIGPAMARRGWGRIVVGSSIGVKFGGGSDSFAYALANHASEFIPRDARTWAEDNVLTNVVRIGVTSTNLHAAFPGRDLEERASKVPMKRFAAAEEISEYLYWMGSPHNTYLTGQVTAISGGE